MSNTRLAGRYAKSLIDLAVEKNQLGEVYQDMLLLQSICKSNRDFVNLLRSPIINPEKKRKIMESITNPRVSEMTASFNRLLIAKGREGNLPDIVTAFIQQYKDHQGIHIVRLITTTPVSDELKNAIESKIRSSLGMDSIELNTEVDPTIIGGFVLEIGDKLVDASVAYELHMIRKEFESNDFIYNIR
jgi:F-type H+-transporting ATPase subunit delta